MRQLLLLIFAVIISSSLYAADGEENGYSIDEQTWNEAMAIYHSPSPVSLPFPNPDHSAQWFPKAGFGLFMHWGIHSVDGIDPSWAMMKGCPWHGNDREYRFYWEDPSRYYDLAKKFNPIDYDPDLWMAAAQKAGFQYAVLTTKHHDGYALWPTKFGNMNTRVYLNGRDLLRPYVEACRKYGLKVGFYFSPRDWRYPGYTVTMEYGKKFDLSGVSPEENEKHFQKFYAYTFGQLKELLTQYGTIDVLWFDGMGWDGIADTKQNQTIAWVRSLQPGIAVNPRWSGEGDFKTTECQPGKPENYRPGEWWEACDIWMQGSWGYAKSEEFKSFAWVFEKLTQTREWGGNFLCNVGPRPDGKMPENFYINCQTLSEWMKHNQESIIGADAVDESIQRNVPCTRRGNRIYAHILPSFNGTIIITAIAKPRRIFQLQTGKEIAFRYENHELQINSEALQRSKMDDVAAIELD